MGATDICDYWY